MMALTSSSRWDAIVIGSGMGGMVTAAYLCAAGKRTLLLEQYEVLGGCTHVFRRKKKWEFEVGLHYMEDCGEGGLVPSILNGLGLAGRIEFLRMDEDGFDTIIYPNAQLKVPMSWDQYTHNLIELFPKEGKAISRFVGILKAVGMSVDRSRTPGSHRGTAEMIRNAGLASVWALAPLTSLMAACGLSARAQAMLTPQSGAYNCPPSRTPVILHAGFIGSFIKKGAWYPKGGGQVFAAHLADVIRSHGGEIRLSTGVERILVSGGAVQGIRTIKGEVIHSPVVISAADIKRTYLDMIGPEHLKPRTTKRINNYRMSRPFINVYLGVDLDLRRNTPNSNYYSCPTWDSPDQAFNKLMSVSHSRKLFADKAMECLPAYVHCSNTKDPTNKNYAPEGCSAIEVMTLAPESEQLWGGNAKGEYWKSNEYQDFKSKMTEVMIQRLIEVMPAVKGKILYQESATPLTQERYTWSTNGSSYGIEPSIFQFGPFRPTSKTEIKGLFLAGASTTWGPSVAGGMISGLHAASAVLGRDLDAEVRSGKVLADRTKLSVISENWDPLKASMKPVKRAKALALQNLI